MLPHTAVASASITYYPEELSPATISPSLHGLHHSRISQQQQHCSAVVPLFCPFCLRSMTSKFVAKTATEAAFDKYLKCSTYCYLHETELGTTAMTTSTLQIEMRDFHFPPDAAKHTTEVYDDGVCSERRENACRAIHVNSGGGCALLMCHMSLLLLISR